jgi:hypothetical protein
MMDQRNSKSVTSPVPSSSKSSNSMDMQASSLNDIMRSNMMMKSLYNDELSTRPNPVDVGNIHNANKNPMNITRTVDNNNVFQSFMGQYWEDLPTNISSAQVVDEIIATFQQQPR